MIKVLIFVVVWSICMVNAVNASILPDLDPKCSGGTCCLPVIPHKPSDKSIKSPIIADPIADALVAVKTDAETLKKAVNDRAALQKLLDQAAADVLASTNKLVDHRLKLNVMLDDLLGNKPLPVSHNLQIVMISNTTCQPCIKLGPMVDALIKNGVDIKVIQSDKEKVPFEYSFTPTWIMIMDGKEVQRVKEGTVTQSMMQTWWDDTMKWAKTQ